MSGRSSWRVLVYEFSARQREPQVYAFRRAIRMANKIEPIRNRIPSKAAPGASSVSPTYIPAAQITAPTATMLETFVSLVIFMYATSRYRTQPRRSATLVKPMRINGTTMTMNIVTGM